MKKIFLPLLIIAGLAARGQTNEEAPGVYFKGAGYNRSFESGFGYEGLNGNQYSVHYDHGYSNVEKPNFFSAAVGRNTRPFLNERLSFTPSVGLAYLKWDENTNKGVTEYNDERYQKAERLAPYAQVEWGLDSRNGAWRTSFDVRWMKYKNEIKTDLYLGVSFRVYFKKVADAPL